MTIGLIISNNLWFCPYVNIYTNYLDKRKISYKIISWNRDGTENNIDQFNRSRTGKATLLDYLAYAKHVYTLIKRNNFDRIVVFCPVMIILLSFILRIHYNKKYIVDYRDLSIEQKPLLRLIFKIMLNHSFANIISSPGFKELLPKDIEYVLSHNFNIDKVKEVLKTPSFLSEQPINGNNSIEVLTIGGIRDYESNLQVMDALGNKTGVAVRFVGKGFASKPLENVAKEKEYNNIYFEGYYPKDKEPAYIEKATFLNIFYPRLPSHDTALSNRFYNALIFKKPMITTANTVQGNYVKYYGLGLALENCHNLDVKLEEYLKSESFKLLPQKANQLLMSFCEDYQKFEDVLNVFFDCSLILNVKKE